MSKKRSTHTMKELVDSKRSVHIEPTRMPKYIVKKPKFFCSLSPYIMWHHNLMYKECPIGPEHRDMVACEKCKCKGDSKAKTKTSKKGGYRRRKDIPRIEKRSKEQIPKIGKTYTSE
jgi:hypothetical protein